MVKLLGQNQSQVSLIPFHWLLNPKLSFFYIYIFLQNIYVHICIYVLGRDYSIRDNSGVTEEGYRENSSILISHNLCQMELAAGSSIQPKET